MKTLRFFNLIIMAFSLAALIILYVTPSFSFNSNIGIDVKELSKFVPDTEYTRDIKIDELIGTDTVHVSISFKLSATELHQVMGGNKEKINEYIVTKNIDNILDTLHEPVDLITDYTIRTVIKNMVQKEVTKHVDEAREAANSPSTTEEIMDEVGINDEYFTNFSNRLYDVANQGASTDELSNALYNLIDEALAKAEESGAVDTSSFDDSKKSEISNSVISVFNSLNLIDSTGHIKKISQISYIYLSTYLKDLLQDKVSDSSELNQKSDETEPDYADRLVTIYVLTLMPDGFYSLVGYVSLGLFIGLFVFGAIWLILLLFTLYRSFSKKPWTVFGPWFWIIGFLQLILGLGLTIFGKYILPKINISFANIPINSVVLAPRTYALILSIFYLCIIVLAIPYAMIRSNAKEDYKFDSRRKKAEEANL